MTSHATRYSTLDIAYLPLVVIFYLFHLAIVRLILQFKSAVASPTQASIMTILASFSLAVVSIFSSAF